MYTFSIPELYRRRRRSRSTTAIWLFLAFFVGFAIKVPMFPFHTWLPDAHVEAPTAGSVILAGVLLKMGTYGFIRFSLPFFPQVLTDAHRWCAGWMITLSIIGIVYGALVSLMQKDMKKLVAYSSVSHLGFCTLGIFALNPAGLSGSVLQQINHGISTGALFLIVGILYERRHTREISEYGGISNVMPVYATITMIMFLSFDGTAAAEWVHRRVHDPAGRVHGEQGCGRHGRFRAWCWRLRTCCGCTSACSSGPVTNPKNEKLHDLTPREVAVLRAAGDPGVLRSACIRSRSSRSWSNQCKQIVQTVRPDLNKPVLRARRLRCSARRDGRANCGSREVTQMDGKWERSIQHFFTSTDYLLALPMIMLALFGWAS